MTNYIQYEIHDKSRINEYVSADGMRADGTEGFDPATRVHVAVCACGVTTQVHAGQLLCE